MVLQADVVLYSFIGIIVTLLIALKLFFHHLFKYWEKRGLYTPKPIFPFGNAINFYNGKECLGELFSTIYLDIKSRGLKHGGFYFWGKRVYIPGDNEIVKKIIISDFEYFPNHGLYLSESMEPLTGHIFNMEGGKWRNLRAKLPAAFSTCKMRKMFAEMVGCQKNLCELLDTYESKQQPVNIKDVLSLFSTDIITKTAFGIETNCLKNKDMDFITHGRSFFDDQWSVFNNTLVITCPRNYLQFFGLKVLKKEATDFFMKVFGDIKDHREKTDDKREDLTNLLIRLTKYNPDDRLFKDFNGKGTIDPMNFNEFAAQAYVFFEAGFETSSSTMTFALYELAKNPDIQENLRREIQTVLEKYDGVVTYDAMLEMKYLENVVDETLRLYPVFPILPRICNKEYQVPGTDLVLEKDTLVVVSQMGLHRDPEFWPDPLVFDPDRFTSENKATRPTTAYMPFGDGPRICIGKRFGLLQSKAGIIGIIRNYQVSLSKKTIQPFKFDTSGIILRTKGDVWLQLTKI